MRKKLKQPKIPANIKVSLKTVFDHFDQEDKAVRQRQLRKWRRLKLLWEGFQRTWFSEVNHDWRIWDDVSTGADDTNQTYYDKPMNVFRAYLESIIAALSISVPPVTCYPDDAESPLDMATAKAGNKIAQLIYRHNNASLLWLHSLFIYCTEGTVFCYGYTKEDYSYGTYEEKEYDDTTENHEYSTCPNCGHQFDDQITEEQTESPEEKQIEEKLIQEKDKFQPDNDDVEVQDVVQNAPIEGGQMELCPACMAEVAPTISREPLIVTRLVGVTQEPKSRQCQEMYGGLFVKVPNYARSQAECPYLIYSYECHYSLMLERFPWMTEIVEGNSSITSDSGTTDPYERWARLSPQYWGEYPINNVTHRQAWLRPCAFNVINEESEREALKKKYPNGCKIDLINDEIEYVCNESLDDCWTMTKNPMSDYVHAEPLGMLLVSVQDITNDLISLILQTIEHGIPQTMADPTVLNFDAYRQQEVAPGDIFPVTPKSGKSLQESFFDIKTSTLSQEVLPFAEKIQELGQLISGALPSLFGGAIQDNKTASGYSMSRAQALQRLQNTWKMFTTFWKEIYGKAIPAYIENVKEDEREVQRNQFGDFANVFIRKAELEGKIGRIELEANENLPITWSQQKDVIMQLLQNSNPEILEILGSPENLPMMREAIGLVDFFIPGEDDRDKQYEEIKLLLNSEPIQMPGPMGMQELPSVEIDQDVDNHRIEAEICRAFLVSEHGRQIKQDNPPGYKNILLHMKAHQMALMQNQMQNPAPNGEGAAPLPKPTENAAAPIGGEGDVNTQA